MAPRRSPRLHPQIQAREEVAGVARRRSPRAHPQIRASEEGVRTTRRRRRTSPAVPASLPDDDDMLREILIRLPPLPSSLPRASAVCKRWRCIVGDPKFHCQFYAHHRKPPLLGFFENRNSYPIVFKPSLNPPDRVPPHRFNLGSSSSLCNGLLDCRHGLVLVKDDARNEVLVCNPITSHRRRVVIPPEFNSFYLKGAVICAAGDDGHVHGGGCHSSPFKLVLVSSMNDREDNQPLAFVYSSETSEFGNLISIDDAPLFDIVHVYNSTTLVGNVLYWLSETNGILEFDLDRRNLAVTMGPPDDFPYCSRRIIQAEDGALGIAISAHSRLQMWQRNVNCQGAATWIPWKTIEMHTILGLPSRVFGRLLVYDDDNGIIFVHASRYVYAVQLKSMHSKKLYETGYVSRILPFTSFYTSGTSTDGGSNGAEMLHGK